MEETKDQEETTTMRKDTPKLRNIIEIDEGKIRDHLGALVRGSVEETLNALLDAEADQLCNASRYERTEARRDTRAGVSFPVKATD
jgi:transposase-like protein